MAIDEDLANRIRESLGGESPVDEKKMFGGLAFLIGGHMAIAVSGQEGLLVRVDPADSDAMLQSTSATPMVMRGRPLKGWLRVEAADVSTKRQLQKWVRLAISYVKTLPPKKK